MYDLIVKNGKIVDGTGAPWFYGDLGIVGGRINSIGKTQDQRTSAIDASGCMVAPGFIDLHSHLDVYLLHDPLAKPKITQGVTTEVLGNCGFSCAPVRKKKTDLLKQCIASELGLFGLEWDWGTIGEYLGKLDRQIAVNVCYLIGHCPVRVAAMGLERRAPTEEELDDMKRIVAEGMREGAFGFSVGLDWYIPSSYASTEEVVQLCQVVSTYGGIIAAHMRSWGKHYHEGLGELVRIGREAHLPVQHSHLQLAKANVGQVKDILGSLEKVRQEGIDIAADVIPFMEVTDPLSKCLPRWVDLSNREEALRMLGDDALRGKLLSDIVEDRYRRFFGWDRMYFNELSLEKNKFMEGKSIEEVSRILGKDAIDVVRTVLIEEGLDITIRYLSARHEELVSLVRHPLIGIVSDASGFGYSDKGGPGNYDLIYGTFPHVLRRYVREEKVLSFEQAIQKFTSYAAARLGLRGRGLLREGMAADIVIFDPDEIREMATAQEPGYTVGIRYVIVNGTIVLENGQFTGEFPGVVLRKNKA